jgi:hypothetical protein
MAAAADGNDAKNTLHEASHQPVDNGNDRGERQRNHKLHESQNAGDCACKQKKNDQKNGISVIIS